MNKWINESIFYHIYPLGFCGAPKINDQSSKPEERLLKILDWIGHFKDLGINALYLGPLFESEKHGYDTINYYETDRRLGTNGTLKKVINELHKNNIKVILDGVFNHTSRDFFAFKDILQYGRGSKYIDWFSNINFSKKSPLNDPFDYETWGNHYALVKLNLKNNFVKEHLFGAVKKWVTEFDIDGLRLDAADVMEIEFLKELAVFTKSLKPDFWNMGEIIHGNYNSWVNNAALDSATNYECYKGLYSSHNDVNLFEIAYSLNREFGENGIYKNLMLYNFADNHDVNRVASTLIKKEYLYTLYGILFTMPGIPSIYYGSEWGLEGIKKNNSDDELRPEIDINTLDNKFSAIDLSDSIKKFIKCRRESIALKYGSYKELFVSHSQLAFKREFEFETAIIAVNSSDKEVEVKIKENISNEGNDILNNEKFFINDTIEIPPHWLRIIIINKKI